MDCGMELQPHPVRLCMVRFHRVQDLSENKRDCPCRLLERCQRRCATIHNHLGRKAYEFLRQRPHTRCFARGPSGLDPQVASLNPTQILKPALESRYTEGFNRIIGRGCPI